jgi:amidase
VLAGTLPGDPYGAPGPARPWADEVGRDPGRLRIGVLADAPEGALPTDAACAGAVQRTATALEGLGHLLEPSAPEALIGGAVASCFSRWWAVSTAATVAAFEAALETPIGRDDLEPLTWALVERGRAARAVDFVRLRDEVGFIARAAGLWWAQGFDLLLTPTLQGPPPPLGELMNGEPETLLERQLRWCPLTPFANMSGQPAISLPVGPKEAGNLPVGLQLIAELGREDLLIQVAAQLEDALPRRLFPPAAG